MPRVLGVFGHHAPESSGKATGRAPLEHLCNAYGYKAATFAAGDLEELIRTIRYLGSAARLPECQGSPLLVHIGVCGDTDGMAVGPDKAPWNRLTESISGMLRDLESCKGPVVFVLAAGGASKTELTELFRQHGDAVAELPRHLFLTVERIPRWVDEMTVWSLFYAEAAEVDFTATSAQVQPGLRRLTSRLNRLTPAGLSYFGWPTTSCSARVHGASADCR